MDRWSGILKVPWSPNSRAKCRIAASLCLSSFSPNPTAPSANVIFFNGDRVEGTGNPVIERLSDLQRIAEILVSKLGDSVNAWVIEASTFNGPFAVYKQLIPSVNKWGEPSSYNPTGFPASSSIVSLLSSCFKGVQYNSVEQMARFGSNLRVHSCIRVQYVNFINSRFEMAKVLISDRLEEPSELEVSASPLTQPKTLLFGFSKGGAVLNQLVTELAFSDAKTAYLDQENEYPMNMIIPSSKESFLDSISEIHYVDVGLNSPGAYLIDQDVIKKVADRIIQGGSGIRFALHGTPRQWSDSWRVWIQKEKDTMVCLLDSERQRCEGKLCICERFYFADKPPTLQMHFEIIEAMDLS